MFVLGIVTFLGCIFLAVFFRSQLNTKSVDRLLQEGGAGDNAFIDRLPLDETLPLWSGIVNSGLTIDENSKLYRVRSQARDFERGAYWSYFGAAIGATLAIFSFIYASDSRTGGRRAKRVAESVSR